MNEVDISTVEALAESWLSLQCQMLTGVSSAIVILGKPDGEVYQPAAVWPGNGLDDAGLSAVARVAMAGRRQVIQPGDPAVDGAARESDIIAYPLVLRQQLLGVVVVRVKVRSDTQRRTVVQLLKWGTAWLEVLVLQQESAAGERLVTVIDVLAGGLEHESFHAAATAVVTDLATRLGCERVSIGFVRQRRVQVQALSHSARYERRSNLIRDIEAAMDEALDQQCSLVYPALDASAQPLITRAQSELSHRQRSGAVCSIPLVVNGRCMGIVTMERAGDKPFDRETVSLCEHLAALIGPTLDLKRQHDRWLLQKSWDAFKALTVKLIGPRHLLFKLLTTTVLGLLLFFTYAEGDYRVAANARLEPEILRVVVAPIDGYIQQAEVRAGDRVRADQPLAKLEDKALKLEYLKWSSQRVQLQKEFRKAFAGHDRAQVNILRAQIAQAEAQIALVKEQLDRVHMTAPFAGIVVNGDLSQRLGSPVERGDVLFELAPLDSYRVILRVDETEIADVAVGQPGKLALAGLPSETLPMVVKKITPVSTAEDGHNFFRVEAHLEQDNQLLRPGMEGVGKIEIERRKLAWIWTHKLFDWLRLWTWSWWPL